MLYQVGIFKLIKISKITKKIERILKTNKVFKFNNLKGRTRQENGNKDLEER